MATKGIQRAEAASENKQLNGDAKESFNLTEWLSNEVKLPQYCDAFVEQGFKFPSECYKIDENVLDLLGIEKIGHRKRMLVSCQRLALRYGLSNDIVTPAKTSDYGMIASPSLSDVINQSDEGNAPPALPPKKGKKSKPALPPRVPLADESASIEQEVHVNETFGFNTTTSSGENSDNSTENCSELLDSIDLPETQSKPLDKDKETSTDGSDVTNQVENLTATDSTLGLPPGSSDIDIGYEPMWEAFEGTAEVVSPKETMQESCMPGTVDHELVDSKSTETPPPIPPRADLDDTKDQDIAPIPPDSNLEYEPLWQVSSDNINTPENSLTLQAELVGQNPEERQSILTKKVAPKKPPRKNKPMPLPLTDNKPTNDKCSLVSPEGAETYNPIYEMEVFEATSSSNEKELIPDQNIKRKIEDTIHLGNDNIYDNAEQIQKLGRGPLLSIDAAKSSLPRKPIPVPRSRSLSGNEIQNLSHSASAAELPKKTVIEPHYAAQPDIGAGSCTDDDLSGSDEEDLETDKEKDEEKTKVDSTYEIVDFTPRISMLQVREFSKEGYLYKQGGQQNNKGWKKRWVVFDRNVLCYYKDKEHTNESLQRVPVAIMNEVRLVPEETKRARFDLLCVGRTYLFALNPEEMNAIQMWAQILMGAIILSKKDKQDTAGSIRGGIMGKPDKQGYLKKQGNSVVADWKKRYVVIKEDKLAYYHNHQDFLNISPIHTLQMSLASAKEDPKYPSRFQLVTPHRMYVFQCDDEQEAHSWIDAFKSAIQLALSDRTVINKIWENPSNRYCADCGKRDPVWASINLVVCVCENCIGVHRKLGVHTSKPRSLIMDEKIWKPSLIKLMVEVGNEFSNRFWKFRFPEDDQIDPDCTSEEREEFIRNKYVEKRYRHVSSLYGDAVALGEALRKVVVTDDIEETMQLLFSDAKIKYVPADGSDTRTPYELAKDANQENQMEFLLQNGANTTEPEVPAGGPVSDGIYEEPNYETFLSSETYEKRGYLQKKSPNAAVWKKREFTLIGRELKYERGDREDPGVIKLKDVIEYAYNDTVTLDIITKDRTYNLRADTKEEARSWYTFLRNKQVFQIPLADQELGSDGIPHLVAKCMQFVESYGMDAQGIYRKNGNKAKIKQLKKLFDQDAESVLLSQEEYEVHDVAGLLKEYFRELPDPLMTEDAYAHFITASLSADHNTKLYTYKESLMRLADVNRNTLKAVIGHLKRVSSQSDKNLMKMENVSLIFGPTLMSNKQTGSMDTNTINQEFTVIGDFINFYKWLFDVGEDEEKKEKVIEDAIEKMNALMNKTPQNPQSEVDKLTMDIYSFDLAHESSRITVHSYSKASEICQELVSKRALAPDGRWGLFQVVNREQERPFPATEKVLATIIETGKYSQMSKDSYLIVKENYVSQKMNVFGFQDDMKLAAGSMLQTMKEAKKKESWKKLYLYLENGCLSVYKNAKSKDVTDSWPVNETTLYIGIDKDKKPYSTFGLTIVRSMKDDHCIYRYICFDNEFEQYRWISIFLMLKYPGQNMWVDPDLQPIGYYAEAVIPGRASNPPKQKSAGRHGTGGVSANVVNELRMKQGSFKKRL